MFGLRFRIWPADVDFSITLWYTCIPRCEVKVFSLLWYSRQYLTVLQVENLIALSLLLYLKESMGPLVHVPTDFRSHTRLGREGCVAAGYNVQYFAVVGTALGECYMTVLLPY